MKTISKTDPDLSIHTGRSMIMCCLEKTYLEKLNESITQVRFKGNIQKKSPQSPVPYATISVGTSESPCTTFW